MFPIRFVTFAGCDLTDCKRRIIALRFTLRDPIILQDFKNSTQTTATTLKSWENIEKRTFFLEISLRQANKFEQLIITLYEHQK